MILRSLLLALPLTVGCVHSASPQSAAGWPEAYGPRRVSVDLLRTYEGGPRIYVQALLPDGEPALFMVDTGSDTTAISQAVADRLGLEVRDTNQYLTGIGGTTRLRRAELSSLELNGMVVPDLSVAVAPQGLGEWAGGMQSAGLIGNDVWSRFLLEIDYPADLMVLHQPTSRRGPRSWSPMLFNGQVNTPIRVEVGPDHAPGQLIAQVDTGASDLIIADPAMISVVDEGYTEGLERLLGIGGSESLPPSQFLRTTRRVQVHHAALGGQEQDVDFSARWINFGDGSPVGPPGLTALVGHDLINSYRLWIDYQGGRFAMTPSRRRARQINGHTVLLAQEIARYGEEAPQRRPLRARLYLGLDQPEEAIAQLQAHLDEHPSDTESRVLLVHLLRGQGDHSAAWELLEGTDVGQLVDEGELVAAVNGLILEGEIEQASALANSAVGARPEEADAYVAVADALYAARDPLGAQGALREAMRVSQNPDGWLLRRARVAWAMDDRFTALTHLRTRLQVYPMEGSTLWVYALMTQDAPEHEMFRHDMDRAMARLHPTHRPLDFITAANHTLGDQDLARQSMEAGIQAHCVPTQDEALRANCEAWYWALAGVRLDDALANVQRALSIKGDRSDFLDTLATVHMSRGELPEAHRAAVTAARLSADDVYMLWQADRIGALVGEETASLAP